MKYVANIAVQKLAREFKKPTRINIQVNTAVAIVSIGHDEGDIKSGIGGLKLSQANTAGNEKPYQDWWQGELWYNSTVDATNIVIETMEEL